MKVIFILLIFSLYTLPIQAMNFYGDISVNEHLLRICSNSSLNRPRLVVIETKPQLTKFLLNINCKHFFHLNNVSFSVIQNILNDRMHNSNRFQLIFNMNWKNMDFSQYRSSVLEFAKLQHNCPHCFPNIILLSAKQSVLLRWTKSMFTSLDRHFYASVFSLASSKVFHIRPIIFGCVRHEGIFVPKSNNDFSKLKVSYRHCNLQNTKLNVSVNHVRQ